MKLKTNILILGTICLSLLFSCKAENNEYKNELNGTAKITLSNDEKIDFKTTFTTNISVSDKELAVGLSNSLDGIMIYLTLSSNETLAPGTHKGYIMVKPIDNPSLLSETYNSQNYQKGEFSNKGYSELIITNMENHRIKGTFSGVLYSKTGEKIILNDGKFDIEVNDEI